MFNRNTNPMAVITLVSIGIIVATVGVGMAADGVLDSELPIDNSTETATVELNGSDSYNGGTAANGTVIVTLLNDSGDVANGTEVVNKSAEIAANDTQTTTVTYDLSDTEAETYSYVHANATVPDDESGNVTADLSISDGTSGGGGGSIGSSGTSIGIVVVVIGALYLMREED